MITLEEIKQVQTEIKEYTSDNIELDFLCYMSKSFNELWRYDNNKLALKEIMGIFLEANSLNFKYKARASSVIMTTINKEEEVDYKKFHQIKVDFINWLVEYLDD